MATVGTYTTFSATLSQHCQNSPPPPPPPPCPPPPRPPDQDKFRCSSDRLTVQLIQSCQGHLPQTEEDEKERIRYLVGTQKSWRDLEEEDKERCLWLIHNSPVSSIIQDGPTCGLVVLLMAGQMLKRQPCQLHDILLKAQCMGFTKQGEIFSADNLLILSKLIFKCNGKVVLNGLTHARYEVLDHLHRGLPVLVPYDADANNSPTNKGGHKSHWAILTGYAIFCKETTDCSAIPRDLASYVQDSLVPTIYLHKTPSNKHLTAETFNNNTEIVLFARQGKSIHLGMWPLEDLANSNANLKEFRPDMNKEEYVFPSGGVEEGLCSKVVLLWD